MRFATIALLTMALPAAAQNGSLRGVVYRDSLKTPVADALVRIPEINRETRANVAGEFRLAAIPAGTWIVTIRRPGLQPVSDSVVVREGRETRRTFVLDQLPQTLDSVIARADRRGLTASMRQLEARRASGMGRFLLSEQLRKMENRSLPSVIAAFSGARQVHYRGFTFLSTSRGMEVKGLGVVDQWPRAIVGDRQSPRGCWVQVYVDGLRMYSVNEGGDVPDLRMWQVMQLEAVEYYRGPAETPQELNALGSPCGTLVLWTRQKP